MKRTRVLCQLLFAVLKYKHYVPLQNCDQIANFILRQLLDCKKFQYFSCSISEAEPNKNHYKILKLKLRIDLLINRY